MTDYDRAVAYAEKLDAALPAPCFATVDPRSAVPPCVLIGHTGGTISTNCGEATDFYAALLLPGPWNADAWKAGAELAPIVYSIVPAERRAYVLYRLALDSAPIPAYLFTWTEDTELWP
jgi:hypothetical protein